LVNETSQFGGAMPTLSRKEETLTWTDKLIEPLASVLRNTGPWLRVEKSRGHGWIFLAGNPGDPAVNWSKLDEDGNLSLLEPMKDKRLPAMATACSNWISAGYSLQLLAWRVGSRAIFRLSQNHNFSYAKIFRKDRITVPRWEHLRAGSPGGLWRVPAILQWDEENKILLIEERRGNSLNQQWTAGIWIDEHLTALSQVLEWLANAPIHDSFPIHTIDDEIRILETRMDVFHQTLREPHENATRLIKKTIERLKDLGEQKLILVHRDLHDKQIITSWEGGSLIDLDLLAQGSPALDPGNIIAHCRLRSEQGYPVPWKSIATILSTEAAQRGVEKEALVAWTASTLARISMIYARRKRKDHLISTLLKSLDDLLEDRGEWEGILS
jgi:hypothetical protein